MQHGEADRVDPMQHLGLVRLIAHRYLKRIAGSPSLTFDDLMQAGFIGLMRATKTFDPKQAQFSTYAVHWIRHSMNRTICNESRTVRVPVYRQDKSRGHREVPTRHSVPISFTPSRGDSEVFLPDLMQDRFEPEPETDADTLEKERKRVANKVALEHLDDRERVVIRGRYWEEQTLQQIGDKLGLSRERVRQIEAGALRKLKQHAECVR